MDATIFVCFKHHNKYTIICCCLIKWILLPDDKNSVRIRLLLGMHRKSLICDRNSSRRWTLEICTSDWRRNCTDGILQKAMDVWVYAPEHSAQCHHTKSLFHEFYLSALLPHSTGNMQTLPMDTTLSIFPNNFQRFGSINGRLPFAQQVDVRAIDYLYSHLYTSAEF